MIRSFFIQIFLLIISITSLCSQWSNDPAFNTLICNATGDQASPVVTTDGNGGVIAAWTDNRDGSNFDIYAQRLSSKGYAMWTTNGVAITTAANNQQFPQIISDGYGGAILTWQDRRDGSYHIYAQRIDAAGSVRWTNDGVLISNTLNTQLIPTLTDDGSGGAIITWEQTNGGYYDVYAQRIDSTGNIRWNIDGVAICTVAKNFDRYPVVVKSGVSGAIIAWRDYRNTTNAVYAQKIDSSGNIQWPIDGIALIDSNVTDSPIIVSDGADGAIVAWNDYRSGTSRDIYAQRIDSSGTILWTPKGVGISVAPYDQWSANMIGDGISGAVLVWRDQRSSPNSHIYGQRIDASGVAQWDTNGIPVCTVAGNQYMPKVCSDGLGGFITAWQDVRSPGQIGIYAQRINTAGSLLWSPSGIILTTNSTSPSIVANNSNGLIAVWTDYRTPSTAGDILGQSIDGNSNLTGVSEEKVIPKEFSLFQNYPNPFNPVTTIRYQLPINSHLKLKVFDLLGIEVSTLVNENKNAGSYEVEFDGSKLPSGVYFYRLQTGSYVETKKLLLMK